MTEKEIEELLQKRSIDASLGELADAIIAKLELTGKEEKVEPLPAIIRGVNGLASLLNCSHRTALKFTSDKRFESAIKKEGNLIIVETQKFLSIYGSKKGGRNY